MKALLTTLLSVLILSGFSQEISTSEKKLKHEMGFAAGMTTGVGLSHRMFKNEFGLQSTFGVVNNNWDLGVTGLVKIKDNSAIDLFIFAGASLWNSNEERYDINGFETESKNITELTFGFGPGVEFSKNNVLGFNLMVGYGFFDVTNQGSNNRIGITVETGIFYKL